MAVRGRLRVTGFVCSAGRNRSQAPALRLRSLLRALERTVFLGAARQVETEVFPVPLDVTVRRGDVGVIGQFAAWWLYTEGDTQVSAARRNSLNPHCVS